MAYALPPPGTGICTIEGGKTEGEADRDSDSDGDGGFELKSSEDWSDEGPIFDCRKRLTRSISEAVDSMPISSISLLINSSY